MIPGSANPLLLAADAAAGGYSIARSLRFNSADSAYLSRTPASAGNRKTWTWAGWVKKVKTGDSVASIFSAGSAGITNYDGFIFGGNNVDTFAIGFANAAGNSNDYLFETTQVFRDPSAWYHIIVALDTTQSTASNRLKIYINGVEVTSISGGLPAQNYQTNWINTASLHSIGTAAGIYFGSRLLNAYLADCFLIDGQALTPSSFGEFDATTGVWNPKAYTGTYGTNGFHLDFADNSNNTASTLGKDTSGNGNNWTPNNLSVFQTYNNAVIFDGSGDSFTAPSGASISGTGDFTIEFWIQPRSFGSGYQVIYANDTLNGVSIGINSTGTIFYGRSLASIEGTTSNSVAFGQWNHFALTRSSGTLRMFINGTQGYSGSPSLNYVSGVVRVGADGGGSVLFLNGLLSSLRTVSGSALYTSNFTPSSVPLSAVSGTTLLTCQSSTLIDQSSNAYTLTSFGDTHVVRSLVTGSVDGSDSLVDSPTNGSASSGGDAGGVVVGNYATLNPLQLSTAGTSNTLANGNLESASNRTANDNWTLSTIALPSSGKWYCEVAASAGAGVGLLDITTTPSSAQPTNYRTYYGVNGNKVSTGSTSATYGATFTTTDVIGIAADMDAGTLVFYKNGSSQGTAYTDIVSAGKTWAFGAVYIGNTSNTSVWNFGQRPFAYAAPSGFKSLNTANLPASTILKGSDYFDTKLYTGNGSTQTISGLAFSPDLVWLKNRSAGDYHRLNDIIRGANRHLFSNTTDAEVVNDANGYLSAFTSDGFSLTSGTGVNASGNAYTAWCWDGGTSTVTNTQGSITSTCRTSTSSGFSIVTYTGNLSGSGTATVGHGLGVAPQMVITKRRNGASDWVVQHGGLPSANNLIYLNSTSATSTSGYGTIIAPTSSVFTTAWITGLNTNGDTHVAYCFAPVSGYSSFGSYTGNGSADGPFVYTGFRVKYLIQKKASSGLGEWIIWDSSRKTYNSQGPFIFADSSAAEGADAEYVDFLSNGFKIRTTNTTINQNGVTSIYIAFAENPFSIARAR